VAARRSPKTSAVWREGWDEVLDGVAAGCALAPRKTDLGAFVRARITLEVELQTDRERGVLLAADVERRLQALFEAVDERVGELRAANAPGTLQPPMRPMEEGELVLRAPIAPLVVSSPFGRRSDPFTGQPRFHAGTDIDAPYGTSVSAAASGLVVYAGLQGGYGRLVIVDHGDGVRTHYAHLSAILVEVGQLVHEAEALGAVGSTGRSTGPHLHFAVTNAEGAFLDPVALLDVPYETLAGQVRTSMR
jgi:murein DD-endopeptidase MepM/ murein hydrolase activator NlpD